MTKNWSVFLQKVFQQPETVDEAVEQLMTILEDELIDLHFSLGMAIRNAFGLHVQWSELLASCDVMPPDEAWGDN